MSTDYASTPVADLVTERPSWFRVFEKWGIDYCCGGSDPLGQVCGEKGLDVAAVAADLAQADARQAQDDGEAWADAPIPDLIENIVSTHHAYLRQVLPELRELSAKVLGAHGERHPELGEVRKVLLDLAGELESHLLKEEQILFPFCVQVAAAASMPSFHCQTIANPIRVMEAEHESAGRALLRLRALTKDYSTPDDGCASYRALMQGLADLEVDLHRHIHKENHVLFPRALAIEARLA